MHIISGSAYAHPQREIGICGVALLVAIRSLRVDRALGIARLNREIDGLSRYPEPEMRRIAQLAMSFLSPADLAMLREVQSEVEFGVLSGAADDNRVLAA
ncbi:MAG: hypothetical protein KME15_19960 [Drouetiella hepatica Uher 2000/2452]|jgi:hypothetical protein|uniref:Uncharacterized protein n=1 Tax=Drouetiella hepatica Uher 2000/2452 TaxID=904376 RepID=A0A951QCX7_9CYAN|nr:hypothetical protein [Drouetiella hepatica Uher 2000/2452]